MRDFTPDELNYLLRLTREDLKKKQTAARNDYSFKILLKFRNDLIKKLEYLSK